MSSGNWETRPEINQPECEILFEVSCFIVFFFLKKPACKFYILLCDLFVCVFKNKNCFRQDLTRKLENTQLNTQVKCVV